ncbi:MAG: TIGR04086 family membrane protein [Lachnospiraceae bacterium]|nr:TIGR04086 family membrane protein [Lachnospiraceae bacterium]MBQ7777072.1 TIGR04086 family membrane protein [Lachnospiraceae bacterium]
MKKITRRQETGIPWMNLLMYIFCSFVVTMVILLVMALLLYKMKLSEQIISAGIIITYAVSCFVGGFLAGKKLKQKRYIWGLLMGIAYYFVLLIVSVVMNGSFKEVTDSLFTTLILCAGGGMLGGMLS